MGTEVEAKSNQLPLQNGSASATYDLSEPVAKSQIIVTDSTGNIIFSRQGETASGSHAFNWDGSDSNGKPVPDGAYQVHVRAENADGDLIDVPTTIRGTVDSASFADGAFTLHLGELAVGLDQIEAVHRAKPAVTQNTSVSQ